MKEKISMTKIMATGKKVYRCGYNELQSLLADINPDYYNCGVYGWNCDIYVFDDIIITTGYRNLRGEKISREITKSFDITARLLLSTNEPTKHHIYLETLRKILFDKLS